MNSDLQSIFFTEIIQNSCNDTDELILQHLITMHFALKIVPWAQTYLLSLLIELRLRSSEKVNRPQEYPSWRFLTGSAFTNCAVCGKHLVLNSQDYAGADLKEWEQGESDSDKLGREKNVPWSHKELATFLEIRSVCEAYGHDATCKSPSRVTQSSLTGGGGGTHILKCINEQIYAHGTVQVGNIR